MKLKYIASGLLGLCSLSLCSLNKAVGNNSSLRVVSDQRRNMVHSNRSRL